jgi:site-specific DNA-methyltransferase (adenine-specific)
MIDQRAYLRDCMDAMAEFPDKFFDLAVVDPPYGIGMHNAIGNGDKRSGVVKKKKWIGGQWDNKRPSKAYFDELRRVSKNQIIWGGNYFADLLPVGHKWLIWDKVQRVNMSDAELAWTSFTGALRIFAYNRGLMQGFQNPNRFHPTEKPVALYDWIFANYAKAGQKVLDTHLGSGSSRIAANKAGIDFWGYELDADYFAAHEKRYANFVAQLRMF